MAEMKNENIVAWLEMIDYAIGAMLQKTHSDPVARDSLIQALGMAAGDNEAKQTVLENWIYCLRIGDPTRPAWNGTAYAVKRRKLLGIPE